MSSNTENRQKERGSALLIVFVFAAILAIMLYREMPSYAFEARRQQEQLLVDRGNEYKHAVKLYYRKVGGFPSSFDQLENTNRMRFLRHRFKDPFTNKDDWRLLHMGPGGQLLDSKVARNPIDKSAAGSKGQNVSSTSNAGSSFSNSSGFGSNPGGFTGLSSSQSNSQPSVVVPAVRQRGSVISADNTGSGVGNDPLASLVEGGTSSAPLVPEQPLIPQSPPTSSNASESSGLASGSGSTRAVQGLFNTQPRLPNGSSSGLGTMQGGGGVAGVASRASGHSIKTIDDQDDYSLWEFYYDPTKDKQPGLAGRTVAGGQNSTAQGSNNQTTVQNGTASSQNGTTQSSTGFSLGNSSVSNNSAFNSPQ